MAYVRGKGQIILKFGLIKSHRNLVEKTIKIIILSVFMDTLLASKIHFIHNIKNIGSNALILGNKNV